MGSSAALIASLSRPMMPLACSIVARLAAEAEMLAVGPGIGQQVRRVRHVDDEADELTR